MSVGVLILSCKMLGFDQTFELHVGVFIIHDQLHVGVFDC